MILAVLLAAATSIAATAPAPPRPPDGTYTYAVVLRGATLGTTAIAVHGEGAGISVKETATFTAPAPFSAVTVTHYDAALRETRYSGEFTQPSGSQHTDLTVTPGDVHVNVPGQSVDLRAVPSAPLEVTDDHLLALHAMLPAMLHATGAQTFSVAVLAGGQVVVGRVAGGAAPAAPSSAKPGDRTLTLDVAGLRVSYWFDPATYVVHAVAIPAQNAEFRLTGE
jgi:hypothetical protein